LPARSKIPPERAGTTLQIGELLGERVEFFHTVVGQKRGQIYPKAMSGDIESPALN